MPYLILLWCALAASFIVRLSLGRLMRRQQGPGIAQTAGKREIQADRADWAGYRDELLLVLADGIGAGHKSAVAAQAAVRTVKDMFMAGGLGQNPDYFFRQAVQGANSAVLRYIPDATAGACLLCVVIQNGLLYYVCVGNCRVDVYRRGHLIPLSEGQTLDVLALAAFQNGDITRDEAVRLSKVRHAYNFVGKNGFREPEIIDVPVALHSGDLIVMTTDGVYEALPSRDLDELLCGRGNTRHKAATVIQKVDALRRPEQDNATILIHKFRR